MEQNKNNLKKEIDQFPKWQSKQKQEEPTRWGNRRVSEA